MNYWEDGWRDCFQKIELKVKRNRPIVISKKIIIHINYLDWSESRQLFKLLHETSWKLALHFHYMKENHLRQWVKAQSSEPEVGCCVRDRWHWCWGPILTGDFRKFALLDWSFPSQETVLWVSLFLCLGEPGYIKHCAFKIHTTFEFKSYTFSCPS